MALDFFSAGRLLCFTSPPHDRLLFSGDQRALEVKQEHEYTCQCKQETRNKTCLKQETMYIFARVC